MNNNEMSFESLYMREMSLSDTKYNKSFSEEDLYDGDSDALICDIKSTENLLDYAETYNLLRSMNNSAKIRMCKKLRNITRGNTRYQDSLESYLSHEISMEEAQEQENPSNDNKVENENKPNTEGGNSGKKVAWYKRIWDAIKNIVNKIIMWIKKKITRFCAWFTNKYVNGVPELEEIMGNPKAKEFVEKEFEKYSYENQSDDGVIELTPNIGENLNKKLSDYQTICTKFAQAVGEIVNKNDLSDDIINHFVQVCYAQGAILKINIPKYNGDIRQYITELKAVEKDIKYEHDPKGYVLNLANARFLSKETTISESLGTNSIEETNKILKSITSSLGRDFEKYISEIQKSLDNANASFDRYMDKVNEIIKNDDEAEMKKRSNDIQVIGFVTTAYKILSGILMLFQKISSKIVSQCNECKNAFGELKEKGANFINGLKGKYKDWKDKHDEAKAKSDAQKQTDREAKQKAKADAAAAKAQKEQEEKNRQNDYWNKVGELSKEIAEKNKRKAEKEKEKEKDEAFNNYNKKRNSDDIKNATSFNNDGSSWESFNF